MSRKVILPDDEQLEREIAAEDVPVPPAEFTEVPESREEEGERSPSRFYPDLARTLDHMRRQLDAGERLTFAQLCPPSSTDRILAMRVFETLLELEEMNELTLTQELDISPPILPHPPIYIDSVASQERQE